jgi:predicted 2-oxoglutarate/Fe(II)-dependent dioxygenase YbiX
MTINSKRTYYGHGDQLKIMKISDFISEDFSNKLIKEFVDNPGWEKKGFHKAMVLMNTDVFKNQLLKAEWNSLVFNIKKESETFFNKKLINKILYVQRWFTGGFGEKHNDTHNYDGTPRNLSYNISTILFLYNNFDGGYLEFPDLNIQIKPEPGDLIIFNGNKNNEHQVSKIIDGIRCTVVAFWDFDNE